MHCLSKITTILTLCTIARPVLARCSDTDQTAACLCTPNQPQTTYPNRCEIAKVFNYLAAGNFTAFLSRVAPDISWTLMGTHPLAGVYHNKTIFAVNALARLANTLDPATPSTLNTTFISGGGEDEWSVQELHALGVCKNGLIYDNKFAWITRWDTQGFIVETRGYLDSALVYRAITENESGEYTYSDERTVLAPGPVGSNCAVEN